MIPAWLETLGAVLAFAGLWLVITESLTATLRKCSDRFSAKDDGRWQLT